MAHQLRPTFRPEEPPDAEKLLKDYRRYGNRELVGKSLQMLSLQERINKVARHPDARVLIIGAGPDLELREVAHLVCRGGWPQAVQQDRARF